MPLPIQNARASSAIHDEFNIVGRYRPQIDEVVVPTALVADLTGISSPLRRRRVFQSLFQGAVAAEFSAWRWEVPPGVVIQVTRIYFGTNGTYIINTGQAQLAVMATRAGEAFMDNRLVLAGENPAAGVFNGTQVAAITGINKTGAASNLGPAWEPNFVVAGVGGAFGFLEMQFNVLNTAVSVALEWTEYTPVA